MNPLDLGGFELESGVFEVRYANAPLLWDRPGAIWSQLSDHLPNMKLKTGQPGKVSFQVGDDIELVVELNRAHVVHHRPQANLERLAEVATFLSDTVTRILLVSDYERVGLRVEYWKRFATVVEAAKAIASAGLVKRPAQVPLAREAELTQSECVTRWETKVAGVILGINSQSRKVNLEIPIGASHLVDIKEKGEMHGIQQYMDYYTRGIVTAEQLRPRVWIEQALQASRKSLRTMIEA